MTQVKEKVRTLTDTVGAVTDHHPENVLAWRLKSFLDLGYELSDAEKLAETRIDLHAITALISAGCSLDLAWRILIGTMWSGEDPLWREPEERPVVAAVAESEDDGA